MRHTLAEWVLVGRKGIIFYGLGLSGKHYLEKRILAGVELDYVNL